MGSADRAGEAAAGFAASGGESDQRIVIHGVSWEQYEDVRARLDDIAGLRMAYLAGSLEIMSPSSRHELIKTMFARLVEIHALERGIELIGAGSTTFRERIKETAAEPDECYCVGSFREEHPDIAFEVVLTSGGLDKLEVYGRLGVPEVWFWFEDGFRLHRLTDEGTYERIERSELVPDIDCDRLLPYLERPDQTQAVREYRDSLRAG